MSDKALYVLAGYDRRTEEILTSIQNKLYEQGFSGIQTKDIPMHFTLGSYPPDREDILKERLHNIAASQSVFRTGFDHVGLFRLPENDVLFIAPEISRDMLALKDNFLDSTDTFSWSPHTTMLIDVPDVIHEAIPAVLKEFSAFTGTVSVLHLYEFRPARHILSVQLTEERP